jgi:hypothetical protein
VASTGSLKQWISRVTGTDKVTGCACCLAKTKGVSDCFLQVCGLLFLKEFWEGLLGGGLVGEVC